MCSNCRSEITEFEQAYIFNGNVVCQLCEQELRRVKTPAKAEPAELKLIEEDIATPPAVPAVPPGYLRSKPSFQQNRDLDAAKKKRALYLTFFVLAIIGNGITMATPMGLLLYLPCLAAFLYFFLSTAKTVGEYSTWALVGIGLGLFIPGVSIIILLIVDTKLYQSIRDADGAAHPDRGPREFCSMGLYSLILFLFPYIGLPLAYFALRRISRSEGRLYGKTLAVISLVLNALMLGLLILIIILALLDEPAAATGGNTF